MTWRWKDPGSWVDGQSMMSGALPPFLARVSLKRSETLLFRLWNYTLLDKFLRKRITFVKLYLMTTEG
jgi:hypothetical protein